MIAENISESEECTIIDWTEDGIRESKIGFECGKAWNFHEGMFEEHFR